MRPAVSPAGECASVSGCIRITQVRTSSAGWTRLRNAVFSGPHYAYPDCAFRTTIWIVTAGQEGVLIWILLSAGAIPGIAGSVGGVAFLVQFILVWLGVWLVANGPMRVPFIRRRFHGGRIA